MKFSKLFTKTEKNAKEFDSKNATYLIKAGFVDQVMAGVYSYLPLGLRVLQKIENIVREEMDEISNEVLLPAISPKENWQITNRLETIDVLFKAMGANKVSLERNSAEYVLNPTHEDIVTPLAQKFNISYKDFPLSIYQIQNKFRNEARPKSGILRGREFRMKDAYSFHVSEESLNEFYEVVKEVYVKIFDRLGLGKDTVVALASGGDFTENFSHEFQTFTDAGEDVLFYDEKNDIYYNREVTPSKAPNTFDLKEEMKQKEDVLGEGIIGVKELADFLKIEIERTTKTMLFKEDTGFVAVAVRGDYEVDEGKLKKVLGTKLLRLATNEEVKEVTGTVVGYVGILGLPKNVKIIIDESCSNRVNFEVGGNKENYHTINVNWGVDINLPEKFYDIKVAKEGDLNPETDKPYKTFKSAEVGNIFPLNVKFSEAFKYNFTNEQGKESIVYMGSYGVGTTRVMGVIAEIFNDEKGLLWPKQIAPYSIHLVSIGKDEDESLKIASNLYSELWDRKIDTIWDDRNVNPGEKFADADLIGIPIRVVVSKKSLEAGGFEVKFRDEDESKIVSYEELMDLIRANVI